MQPDERRLTARVVLVQYLSQDSVARLDSFRQITKHMGVLGSECDSPHLIMFVLLSLSWSSQLMRTGLVLSLHLPCHTFVLNLLSFTNSPYKTTSGSAGLSPMEWPAPTPDS